MPADTEEALHRLVDEAMGELDLCGCGTPGPTLLRMLVLLDEFGREHAERLLWKSQSGDVLWQLPLYVLDRLYLIEHGGAVDFGWLTDKGREFLANYRQLGPHCARFIDKGQTCPGCLRVWGIEHRPDCPLPRLGVTLYWSRPAVVRPFEVVWAERQRELPIRTEPLGLVRFGWEIRGEEEWQVKRGERS